MKIEIEREGNGRWTAEIPALTGDVALERSREEAIFKVEALALRVLAGCLDHGEENPELRGVFVASA